MSSGSDTTYMSLSSSNCRHFPNETLCHSLRKALLLSWTGNEVAFLSSTEKTKASGSVQPFSGKVLLI
uniref:Uncharacterized protein n=1 Tax=Anguilla anguilla TaxID=7936 RepID=A0A0E9XV10_ANGAN